MNTTTAERRPGVSRRARLVTAVIVLMAAIAPGAGHGERAISAAERAAWRAYVGAMQAGLLAGLDNIGYDHRSATCRRQALGVAQVWAGESFDKFAKGGRTAQAIRASRDPAVLRSIRGKGYWSAQLHPEYMPGCKPRVATR